MARKRILSPQFFKHAELFDAEQASGFPLRLAFEGLWVVADKRGLFEWKPRQLQLDILPYDKLEFEDVLQALLTHGFINTYTVAGKRYGQIPSFGRWQTFHHNESVNDCPNPPNGEHSPAIGESTPDNGRDSRTASVSVSVTASASGTAAVGTAGARPEGRDPRKKPAPDANMLRALQAAALPHEALALQVLLAEAPSPFAVVGEVYACGSGMNSLRGLRTGNDVEIQHVLRAISELAANGQSWSVRLFRKYAQVCADRPAQTANAEEKAALKMAAEIEKFAAKVPVIGIRDADGVIVSTPILVQESAEDRAERDRIRKESMANFRRMARGEAARDPANTWPAPYTPAEDAA